MNLKMNPIIINALTMLVGVILGYCIKKVKYYSYNPPNLTYRYTYNEIIQFVGGSPVRRRRAICGSRNNAIVIDHDVMRTDNTILFEGSFHVGCSPSNPGHQSLEYSVNKKINETRAPIYIFVKMRPNEYAFIGMGLRKEKYRIDQRKSRNVLVFPIRYTSGSLSLVMKILGNEVVSSTGVTSSGNSSGGSDD